MAEDWQLKRMLTEQTAPGKKQLRREKGRSSRDTKEKTYFRGLVIKSTKLSN